MTQGDIEAMRAEVLLNFEVSMGITFDELTELRATLEGMSTEQLGLVLRLAEVMAKQLLEESLYEATP